VTLRFSTDALRLRLSAEEVRQLGAAGLVEDEVAVVPGAAVRYAVRMADLDRLAVEMDGPSLTVLVPRDWVEGWVEGETVGFEGTQDAGDGRRLAITLERDLGCAH